MSPKARSLAYLGAALLTRFGWTGHRPDLDRAIEAGEQAVAATPPGHPNWASYLVSLGTALGTRYQCTGQQADLDRAIELGEEALAATSPDHPDRARCLSHIGIQMQARFARSGQVADLDRAIEVSEAAAAATPPDHPDRARRMSNLGTALRTRFDRTGQVADLDRAIEVGEAAVAAAPPDEPAWRLYRSNIGAALLTRFELTGEPADLDSAMQIAEQTLIDIPNADPRRALYLDSLGSVLRARFEQSEQQGDLDRAIELGEAAVAACPPDQSKSVPLFNLGDSLRTRFERTGHRPDLDRAVEVFQEAACVAAAAPLVRLQAARWWGRCAGLAGDWVGAVQAFEVGAELMGRVAPRGLGRADQEHQLAQVAGIGSEAAAACLQAADADPGIGARWRGRAVELFEQGRGVLFAQALDTRTDLTDLAVVEPDLAEQFTALVTMLDQPTGSGAEQFGTDPVALRILEADVQRRWRADEELEQLLARIRALDGFATFLLPPPLEQLLPADAQGPVVLVNVARVRCDALILTPDRVETVPLPGLTPDTVLDQVNILLGALGTAHDPGSGPAQRDAAEQAVFGVLAWVWDKVTGPVLDHLGLTSTPAPGQPWPRVHWCPSGLTAFLPLHAAGQHLTPDLTPATVADRVVSSTIPTIRALQRARDDGVSHHPGWGQGRLLVIAMPHTPGHNDLPGSVDEAAFLTELLPDRVDTLGLDNSPQATRDSVLGALPTHRWAHFSCHGATNLADPSSSHLLLSDHEEHPLTVLDLAHARLPDPTLAFLSACSTARTGADLPDEPIHLAAACQLAGYQHVIATQWPIGDHDATLITKTFYRTLTNPPSDPATALHTATQALRANHPTQPTRWAAHTHTGP